MRATIKAPSARLTLSKTSSRATVRTGGLVTFSLHVRNAGGSTAHRIVICDDLPSALVAMLTSPRATTREDGTYCWKLASLTPGRSRTLRITVSPLTSLRGKVVNHAL